MVLDEELLYVHAKYRCGSEVVTEGVTGVKCSVKCGPLCVEIVLFTMSPVLARPMCTTENVPDMVLDLSVCEEVPSCACRVVVEDTGGADLPVKV